MLSPDDERDVEVGLEHHHARHKNQRDRLHGLETPVRHVFKLGAAAVPSQRDEGEETGHDPCTQNEPKANAGRFKRGILHWHHDRHVAVDGYGAEVPSGGEEKQQ